MNEQQTSMKTAWEKIAKEMYPEPHAENMTRQIIKLTPSVMVNDMSILEHAEMERIVRFIKTAAVPEVEEMRKYITTILWLRVLQVTNDPKFNGYKFAMHELNIPARIYQLILSIGECTDRDFGIRFVPSMDIEAEDMLTPSQLRELSDKLLILGDEGYVIVETGLPSDTHGELGFMACMLISDDKVYSYRKDHPVYGFIASFFRTEMISKAFDIDYRIYYGSLEDYRAMLSRIYRK